MCFFYRHACFVRDVATLVGTVSTPLETRLIYLRRPPSVPAFGSASVDEMNFLASIRVGDLVVLHARLNAAFNTSMEPVVGALFLAAFVASCLLCW